MRQLAIGALLLLPLICTAQSAHGVDSATARLALRVVVPPVFRILQVTRVRDGYEYRVWTNTKAIVIGGREYRLNRVGESTLVVPAPPTELFIVHGL